MLNLSGPEFTGLKFTGMALGLCSINSSTVILHRLLYLCRVNFSGVLCVDSFGSIFVYLYSTQFKYCVIALKNTS